MEQGASSGQNARMTGKSNVIPFRRRPVPGIEVEVYKRMTRSWSPELRRLMFQNTTSGNGRVERASASRFFATVAIRVRKRRHCLSSSPAAVLGIRSGGGGTGAIYDPAVSYSYTKSHWVNWRRKPILTRHSCTVHTESSSGCT